MAIVIHRTLWTRQPQINARLRRNVGSAIVTFGANYLHTHVQNTAIGQTPESVGTINTATTDGMRGVLASATTSDAIKYANTGVIPASRADFTIIAAGTINTNETRIESVLFYGDESSGNFPQHHLAANSSSAGASEGGRISAYTYDGGFLTQIASNSITAIDGKYHVYGWRNGSNNDLSLWRDGINISGTKSGGTGTLAVAYPTYILQTNVGASARGLLSPVHGVWVLLGAVSDVLMARLTANPWQEFYETLPRRIWVPSAAAADSNVFSILRPEIIRPARNQNNRIISGAMQ